VQSFEFEDGALVSASLNTKSSIHVETGKSGRQQLMEARADIQRQIELLQSGPLIRGHGDEPQFDPVIVKLTATLREIRVQDANRRPLAYFYGSEDPNARHQADLLTLDDARRMAEKFAELGSA
jgi:hypothetical protein